MAQQHAVTSWPGGSSITLPILTRLGDNITGSIFTDQAGTLYIEQSGDNTHWDVATSYPISANVGQGFSEPVVLAYSQVRFVPTTTNPTVIRVFAHTSSAGGLA